MRMILVLAISCTSLLLLACSPPAINVEQDWTFVGRSKADVEEALTHANYFKKDRKIWAPRGSSREMDNLIPIFDSSGTLLGITRLRLPMNLTDGPSIFQRELEERKGVLGTPIEDTIVTSYDDEEHRVVWRTVESEDTVIVGLSLRQHAAIFTTSYRMRSEKEMIKSMF